MHRASLGEAFNVASAKQYGIEVDEERVKRKIE
jgi:hypothetical protein